MSPCAAPAIIEEFYINYANELAGLAVYGGLDNCYIIPNESAAAVRAHVPEENLETMGRAIKHECVY